jgi:hypothetical protein
LDKHCEVHFLDVFGRFTGWSFSWKGGKELNGQDFEEAASLFIIAFPLQSLIRSFLHIFLGVRYSEHKILVFILINGIFFICYKRRDVDELNNFDFRF